MKPAWILILGRTGARIFERQGSEKKLHLVWEKSHPEGRLKEGQLVSDRAGREFDPIGKVSHAGGRGGDARKHSDDLFLKTVADHLGGEQREGVFSRLYLVANPHLLGKFRTHLGGDTARMVSGSVEKDLSQMAEKDLYPILQEFLLP